MLVIAVLSWAVKIYRENGEQEHYQFDLEGDGGEEEEEIQLLWKNFVTRTTGGKTSFSDSTCQND